MVIETRRPLLLYVLPALLAFSLLWAGGKRIESTAIFVIVASACVLADILRSRGGGLRDPFLPFLPWVALSLFFLWTVLSFLFSSTRNYGLDEVFREGGLLLLFTQTASWHAQRRESGEREVRRILQWIVLLALISCGIGILVYLFQPSLRFVGTFFDVRAKSRYWPNAWAEFLLLVWPAVFALETQRYRWVFLGLLWGSLFLSLSRGAVLIWGIQVVISGIWMVKNRFVGEKLQRGTGYLSELLKGVLLAIAIVTVLHPLRSQIRPVEQILRRATFTAEEGRSSIDERWQFWRQAWVLALDRPIFGWGPYSFRFVQARLSEGILETSDHPHSVLLKLTAERGFPAALFFLGALLLVLVPAGAQLVRGEPKHPKESSTWSIPMICLLSVGAVFLHNLIDYNLQFLAISLPLWWMMGVLSATSGREILLFPNTKVVRFSLFSLACFLISLTTYEGIMESTFQLQRRHLLQIPSLSKIQRGSWFSRENILRTAEEELALGSVEDAKQTLAFSLAENSEDARVLLLLGRAALEREEVSQALRFFERALALAPRSDIAFLTAYLSAWSIDATGDDASSKRMRIEGLLQEYAQAFELNTHFIALTPQAEGFRDALWVMSWLFPEKAEQYRSLASRTMASVRRHRRMHEQQPRGYLW